MKIEGSLKNLFKTTGFADSFSFFKDGREMWERITSCRTFSDIIDLYHLRNTNFLILRKPFDKCYKKDRFNHL